MTGMQFAWRWLITLLSTWPFWLYTALFVLVRLPIHCPMKKVEYNHKIAIIDGKIKLLQTQRTELIYKRDNQPEPKKRAVAKAPSKKAVAKKG